MPRRFRSILASTISCKNAFIHSHLSHYSYLLQFDKCLGTLFECGEMIENVNGGECSKEHECN